MNRAGLGWRLSAGLIDFADGLIVGYVLSKNVGFYFARRAVVTFAIGAPDSIWKGPIPMALGAVGTFAYVLPFAFLLVFAVEGFTGATLGKWTMGLRVASLDGSQVSRGALVIRTIVKTSPLWGMTLALIAESGIGALMSAVAAVLVITGFLPVLGASRLSLIDRLTGTCVARQKADGPRNDS